MYRLLGCIGCAQDWFDYQSQPIHLIEHQQGQVKFICCHTAAQFLVINSTKKYLNRSVIANTRRFKYIERI